MSVINLLNFILHVMLFHVRMVDSPEERSLEVLDIPDDMDDDLLTLYFENKRRSGGGNLVSLERCGNQALIVFEDAESKTSLPYHSRYCVSSVWIL